MRPNNLSCRFGIADTCRPAVYDAMRLDPAADQASSVIERARRILVTASIQQSQVGGESDQEPQFLNPQISSTQSFHAVPRIGGVDERFEHVQRSDFDAIAESEFVALGKFLHRGQKPYKELIVRLNRCARALRIVRHRAMPEKTCPGASPLDPKR